MRGSRLQRFHQALSSTGMVAILRGLPVADAVPVGEMLYEEGFRLIEVPLNSPDPYHSIADLVRHLPGDAMVGAGTVLSSQQVRQVADAGGQLQVMPHADVAVIQAGVAAGLVVLPGVATPTEAFAALAAGAAGLKLFPAELLQPPILKAWRAVLPADVPLLPVGGIVPASLPPYRAAGAAGFGLGGALYRPGDAVDTVRARARAFMQAWGAVDGDPG